MTRRLLILTALLLAGAVVNVVVAWRCAAVGRPPVPEAIDDNRTMELWDSYVRQPGPSQELRGSLQHGSGVTVLALSSSTSVEVDPFEWYYCDITRAGWPLRCLEGQRHSYGKVGPTSSQEQDHTVAIWRLPERGYLPWGGHALPLSVLPLGFTLNTAFFSVLIGLAGLLAGQIRRRARLDRGECPRCRYPQKPPYSSDPVPCTECGHCYRRILHARPKQMLQLWMMPLLVPQLALVMLWFVGSVNWPVLRFQLRYGEPIVTVASASTVTIAVLWLTAIGHYAYSDRPSRQRQLLSVSVAVLTSVTAYIALFGLVALARM